MTEKYNKPKSFGGSSQTMNKAFGTSRKDDPAKEDRAKANVAHESEDSDLDGLEGDDFLQASHAKTSNVEVKGILEHPSYIELENKLTAAENQAQENKDKALRAISELKNFQERMERELANTHKYSVEKVIRELLPVLESLEHALQCDIPENAPSSVQGLVDGVRLTYQMLLQSLEKFGVQEINPLGELFDPKDQEAMSIQNSQEVPNNHVLLVLQKGYRLYDRVVRPARVIVAKN